MSIHWNNECLVREFLLAAHSNQAGDLTAYVTEQVKCWGFPEFNPGNRNEYQGFFNYIADVFAQQVFTIEQLLADDSQVLVRFHIRGQHHEEFMGLPATQGELEFSATALFRLDAGMIREVWMYNKHIALQTAKGYRYSTADAAIPSLNCCIPVRINPAATAANAV